MQVSEMDLKLQGADRLPFLKTIAIAAVFQMLGKITWIREAEKLLLDQVQFRW